ncbi:MAG TPA: GNAT family N-acetyltransferase [Acidimicrobiales bacterium]|nr:GNAT family N-acetyltransferase [Acidimicrobiales bacterium]
MTTLRTDLLQWGGERARIGPWRGERDVSLVVPWPDGPPLSAAFVTRCLEQLAAHGCRRVVTGAIAPSEQQGFLACGFRAIEHLELLTHDLRAIPVSTLIRTRRASRRHRAPALLIDHRSFDEFWRLDGAGLDDAISATPRARFRVVADGAEVVGYSVTGRSGRRGYLQRLAVDPSQRRSGIGSALVLDGLRWLRRWRAAQAVVNTQVGNDGALALYQRLGFRREPTGLAVLEVGL